MGGFVRGRHGYELTATKAVWWAREWLADEHWHRAVEELEAYGFVVEWQGPGAAFVVVFGPGIPQRCTCAMYETLSRRPSNSMMCGASVHVHGQVAR